MNKEEFLKKHGFVFIRSIEGADGLNMTYRKKGFEVDEYFLNDRGYICYLLSKGTHVLDVAPLEVENDFSSFDEYLSSL